MVSSESATKKAKARSFEGALEIFVIFYAVCWIPFMMLTKLASTRPHGFMSRPLSGLELLPVTTLFTALGMFLFFGISGWWRSAHLAMIKTVSLPVPDRWTVLAGFGAALIILTVPLSFTFRDVSIPFIQLLTKGGVLLIAPVVDWVSGRKVSWFSWVALTLVLTGLLISIQQRGNLRLPPLCIATIVLYILGYFIRLRMMTRISKSIDAQARKRYFVEEQIVSNPIALLLLAGFAIIGRTGMLTSIRWGFTEIWSQGVLWLLIPLGVFPVVVGVLGARILLDKRENTFCVPLERSASVLAGVAASYLLAKFAGMPLPTGGELIGAALLVCSLVVLSTAPRLSSRKPARQQA
jgi:hypothetical protein